MATVIQPNGITTAFPGGSHTFVSPQQQFPDPRGALYQLPGQMLQNTAANYGAMTGGLAGVGQAVGQMGGQHSGALAGLANALAQNYGAFGNAATGIAGAAAQDAGQYYQSLGGAASANQAALSNLWTQALSSLGGMGNSLAESMGRGQTGYQSALASMQGANQAAVSQFGQKRLDNVGRLGAADAVSNIAFDFGGGGGGGFGGGVGFQATGPGGPIASGSYGVGGGDGGMGISGSMRRTGTSMSPYLSELNDSSVLNQLASADADARDRMDRQQDLYRQDYASMFGQGMLGMMSMGREGASNLRQGMQDFYGNVSHNRPNFSTYLDQARQGFNQSSNDIRGVGDRMSRDYGGGIGLLNGLADQIGSGMRDANTAGFDGMSRLLRRLAPTEIEQAQDAQKLRAMRGGGAFAVPTVARSSLPRASRNLPLGSFYGGARVV